LADFKSAFESKSKSGVKFPKFHTALHYVDFIRLFGMPNNTYSGHWEKAHRFLVKLPYLRTGRNVEGVQDLIMRRVALFSTVYLKRRLLLKLRRKMKITSPQEQAEERRRKFRKRLVTGPNRVEPVTY